MAKALRKVLFVEDQPDTRELVSLVLRKHEIISVGTKAEAMIMVASTDFCLFILDVYLPDGNGEEICLSIRAFDKVTPILFLTGSTTFTERRARLIGAQGMLRKANPEFVNALRERTSDLIAA